jgi:hypothetical protein
MPFDRSFDDIYKLGIKATCEDAGAYCERVDEQVYQGSILERIMNQISKADVVIGDMSGRNPNVFFEIGYAKALDKKIILLTADASDIPFDLKHYAHVIYGESIVGLKENLKKHLEFYLANLGSSTSEVMFGLNLYILGKRLTENEVAEVECPSNYRVVPLSIQNVSGKAYQIGSLLLTAQCHDIKYPQLFVENENRRYVVDPMNDEGWSINNASPLFNGATETYSLCYLPPREYDFMTVHLSVFADNSKRDYIIKIISKLIVIENAS